MATLRTRYVNTDSEGGDGTGGLLVISGATAAYSSLAACITGEEGDLVGADVYLDIQLTCGSLHAADPSGVVTTSGFTTDTTRYLQIRNMDTVGGKWNTSAWRLSVDGYGSVIAVQTARCILKNLQLENTRDTVAAGEGYGAGVRIYDGTYNTDVLGCILKRTGTVASNYGSGAGIFCDGSGQSGNFSNNIIYGFYDGIFTSRGGGSATTRIVEYNNTIIGATAFGIGTVAYGTGHTHAMKNNIVQGGSTEYYWEAHASTEDFATNLSSDNTSPTVGLRSKTVTFVDASGKDYHLDSSDTAAKDAGSDLSLDSYYSFSIDIDGDTRSGTWDIGADEIVTASGEMIALISGSASATLTLSGLGNIISTIPGSGSSTLNLSGLGNLASTIDGTASISAALSGIGNLVVTVTGTSGSTISLNGLGDLISTIAGVGSSALTLNGLGNLIFSAAGVGSVTASLTALSDGSMVATIAGTSTVVASLSALGNLVASIPGTSSITATVSGLGNLNSSINGSSSVAAILSALGNLQMTGAGASSVTAILSGFGDMIASGAGIGLMTSSIQDGTNPPQPIAMILFNDRAPMLITFNDKTPGTIRITSL